MHPRAVGPIDEKVVLTVEMMNRVMRRLPKGCEKSRVEDMQEGGRSKYDRWIILCSYELRPRTPLGSDNQDIRLRPLRHRKPGASIKELETLPDLLEAHARRLCCTLTSSNISRLLASGRRLCQLQVEPCAPGSELEAQSGVNLCPRTESRNDVTWSF